MIAFESGGRVGRRNLFKLFCGKGLHVVTGFWEMCGTCFLSEVVGGVGFRVIFGKNSCERRGVYKPGAGRCVTWRYGGNNTRLIVGQRWGFCGAGWVAELS